MNSPIRVLLADDHPLVRAGIRSTLNCEPDLALVGEAIDGYQAQQRCVELHPDVLLLDLNMPGPSPAQVVGYVRQHAPETRVLVLTAYDDDAYVRGLVAAGAAGYLLKDEGTEAVVRAIRIVVQGDAWFSRSIVEKLAQGSVALPVEPESMNLTEREREVLRLVVEGKTNQEIGMALSISPKTVEKHLGEVFSKLRVVSRVEAAVRAVRIGLV